MLERFRGWSTTVLGPIARLLVRLGVSPDVVTIVGTLGVVLGALISLLGYLRERRRSRPSPTSGG